MPKDVIVRIIGDTSSLNASLRRSESGMAKFARAAKFAGAAVAVGVGVALEKSVVAAMHAQVSQARLVQAFKAAGLSAAHYEKSIQATEARARALGFTNEDTRQAIGTLVTATGHYSASLRQLGIAEDLARFKGADLETATKALAMAHAGSLRGLKQLGLQINRVTTAEDAVKLAFKKHTGAAYTAAIATAKLKDKQLTYAAVLDLLQSKVHGQAQAFSKTLPGAIAEFKAQLENLEVRIGMKLIPVIQRAVAWIRANWPQISATIKQAWASIEPVLIATGQLVASVVNIIRAHWSQIGPIVMLVVDIVKRSLKIMADAIKIVADILQGRWGAAWAAAKDAAGNAVGIIKDRVKLAFDVVKLAIDAVLSAAKAVWNFLSKKIPVPIVGPIVSAIGKIAAAAITAYNAIISLINAAKSLSGVVVPKSHRTNPGGGPGGGSLRNPPRTGAAGGIVTRPTFAMIGEAGPEAVIPLSGASGASRLGSGGGDVIFNFPNYVGTRDELLSAMRTAVKLFEHQNGRPAFS